MSIQTFKQRGFPWGSLRRVLGVAGWGLVLAVAVAAFRTEPPRLARGGSPLYEIAVEDSIRGLKPGAKPKKPTLPKGQVCPYCGLIHPLTVQRTSTNQVLTIDAYRHPITNRWALDYFYCYNCKIWHHRRPSLHAASPSAEQLITPPSPAAATNRPHTQPSPAAPH